MLTQQTQRDIFRFIENTQSESHNYRLQILFELSNITSCKSMLFTLASSHELTIGLNLPDDMQSDYISYYYRINPYSGHHSPGDAVLTPADLPGGVNWENSEYCVSFVQRYGYHHTACMPLYANTKVGPLLGTIELFKQRGEPDFTAGELECLEFLSRYIANNLGYRVQQHTYQRERNLLKGSLQSLPMGYILADADFHITYYNKIARDYALELSHGLNSNPVADLHEQLLPHVATQNPPYGHAIKVELPPFAVEINPFWSQDSLLERTVKDYVVYLWRRDSLSAVDARELLGRYGLTRRELEIAGLLLEGHSNQEISQIMHISYNTVKVHLKNIYGKLGVGSRPAAMHKLGSLHMAL